jgi:hypothetical protein
LSSETPAKVRVCEIAFVSSIFFEQPEKNANSRIGKTLSNIGRTKYGRLKLIVFIVKPFRLIAKLWHNGFTFGKINNALSVIFR